MLPKHATVWLATQFRESVASQCPCGDPCSEQKMAQFRTHDLTKGLAYVSTQQSGQVYTGH
jgi:hypothetical protein